MTSMVLTPKETGKVLKCRCCTLYSRCEVCSRGTKAPFGSLAYASVRSSASAKLTISCA